MCAAFRYDSPTTLLYILFSFSVCTKRKPRDVGRILYLRVMLMRGMNSKQHIVRALLTMSTVIWWNIG
jgi:hypothetical protein